jgi:methyl-accepting chemotaxis protein
MKDLMSDVLGRLRLWQKLALLGWIAAFLVAVPFYLFLSSQQEVVETTIQEQQGVEPVTAVIDLLQTMAAYRDQATNVGTDRRPDMAPVDAAVARFESISGTFGYPGLAALWNQFKQDFTVIAQGIQKGSLSTEQSWTALTGLNQELLALIPAITNGSRLILDPDPDTYNLQAILTNSATLGERLAQVRGLGLVLLAKAEALRAGSTARSAASQSSSAISLEDRVVLYNLAEQARQISSEIKQQLGQFRMAAPDRLKAQLDDSFRQLEAHLNKALPLARAAVVDASTISSSPALYAAALAEAMDSSALVSRSSRDTINELFRQKIQDARVVEFSASAFILLLFGIATTIAVLISRSITGPVSHLVSVMDRLAKGDASVRAHVQSLDEIGMMGRHFDAMVDQREAVNASILRERDQLNDSIIGLMQAVAKLADKDLTVKVPVAEDVTGLLADALNLLSAETAKVVKEVVDIAGKVASVSGQVKSQADTVIGVATDEKREVEQTSAELNQLSTVMQGIAQLARDCNAVAEKAIETTNRAQTTVLGTVEDITTIRDTIRETEKRIKRLGERSQEIGTVVGIINGIAERTHILAINASMHAASAGEAGRGFAVVANEVQKLAENAREATSKISGLVSNIQLETADTITTMNDAITQVVHGTSQAQKAGDEMRETRATTADLVQLVQRIATNSTAQAQASLQLRERASQIQESTERTYEQLQAQGQQTEKLVGFSRDLVRTVSVFNVG